MYRLLTFFIVSTIYISAVKAQADSCKWSIRTNLLYDAIIVPNVGAEYEIDDKWSLVGNVAFTWLKNDSKHRYWRYFSTDVEARRWLMKSADKTGHHIGAYVAAYRYDFEFGGKGNQGNFNYGVGVSYGYALRLSNRLNLDLGIAMGYVGGRYKEYYPEGSDYLWRADKQRHYFGPTKAEATLVWKLGKKKGGAQ